MTTQNIVSLIEAILPAAEEVASIFIHNPGSQHQFAAIFGTVEALTPVAAAISAQFGATSTGTAMAAPAAAPAAVAEPVIPAGVPSAHE